MKKYLIIFILLYLASFVYAKPAIPLPDVIAADTISADGKQLYITGGSTIYIYFMKDLSLVNKFGRAGEGPGEFKVSQFSAGKIYINVQPDYFLVNSLKKISFFTKRGEFIKETRALSGSMFKALGENFVGRGNTLENKTAYRTINIYDSNLKKVKELFRKEAGQVGKGINPVELMKRPLFYISGNRIVFEGQEGVLLIFNTTGGKIFSIAPPYDRIKFTREDKVNFERDFKIHPRFASLYEVIKNQIEYPEYYPLIRHFTVSDKKIYVLTYKERNGKSEFFVFSLAGQLLKKVMLPVKTKDAFEPYPYTISKGKLYQIADNEETEKWELYIIPLNAEMKGDL